MASKANYLKIQAQWIVWVQCLMTDWSKFENSCKITHSKTKDDSALHKKPPLDGKIEDISKQEFRVIQVTSPFLSQVNLLFLLLEVCFHLFFSYFANNPFLIRTYRACHGMRNYTETIWKVSLKQPRQYSNPTPPTLLAIYLRMKL